MWNQNKKMGKSSKSNLQSDSIITEEHPKKNIICTTSTIKVSVTKDENHRSKKRDEKSSKVSSKKPEVKSIKTKPKLSSTISPDRLIKKEKPEKQRSKVEDNGEESPPPHPRKSSSKQTNGISTSKKEAKHSIANDSSDSESESEPTKQHKTQSIQSSKIVPGLIDSDSSEDDQSVRNKMKGFKRPASTTCYDMQEYLKQNPDVETIKSKSTKAAFNLQDIDSDDEVWLVQCPRTVNIKNLLGQKLVVGQTLQTVADNIECISESFSQEKFMTMFSGDSKLKQSLAFKPAGKIVIREKFNVPEIELSDYELSKSTVPFPKGLKVRHPIHGADYNDRINLSDDVKNKLEKAKIVKQFNLKSHNGINLNIKIKAEIKSDSEDDNQSETEDSFLPKTSKRKRSVCEEDVVDAAAVNVKKSKKEEKKNKLHKSSSDTLIPETKEKRKKSKTIKADNDEDLEWLKRI